MSDRPAIHRRSAPFVGEGMTVGPYRKSVVLFDHETHETIRALAIKNGTGFSEQVRLLVEWGLEQGKVS